MSVVEPVSVAPFRWRDGERLIVFGRGRVSEAAELFEAPFVLLTTQRAATAASTIVQLARAVHEVPPGRVDEIAGRLRSQVEGSLLVALGGGRVIDTAKALAAADPPRRVAAVPTTLSGAEMTAIHRHAAGIAADTPRVRPAIVLADPALLASQPVPELAQSAGNALAHAVEGPATTLTNPVSALAALEASRLIEQGFRGEPLDDAARDAVALGALLAGYAIGSAGYGLHHVVSQTLARFTAVPHGAANTIMLAQTVPALARREPEWLARLTRALGRDPAELAQGLLVRSGLHGLRDFGVEDEQLEVCAREASARAELSMTPPRADREELLALYRAAF
jgi:alcohol dehydrogenase class IV